MKSFKQLDIILSIVLICVFAIISLISGIDSIVLGYFIVGGWQIISMIVHTSLGYFTTKHKARYFYQILVIVVITIALLAFVIPTFFLIYYFLFFAAPLMALSYTYICYDELKRLNRMDIVEK